MIKKKGEMRMMRLSLGIPLCKICVIKAMTNIQRDFPWDGVGAHRKISWFKWDTICMDRVKGGLGVEHLKSFNLALLDN
ncbi:hypothetical protein Lal_00001275 [Lupinus albus]|nr:hypothetical protein Lal_00001275 [Lupinus albus]